VIVDQAFPCKPGSLDHLTNASFSLSKVESFTIEFSLRRSLLKFKLTGGRFNRLNWEIKLILVYGFFRSRKLKLEFIKIG